MRSDADGRPPETAAGHSRDASWSRHERYLLTKNEIGVSCLRRNFHDILDGELWWLGKQGDSQCAERLVSAVWKEEHTQELKEKIFKFSHDVDSIAFVSVPSTSGLNMIPIALARRLAMEIGGRSMDGGLLYAPVDMMEAKAISPRDKVFLFRKFIRAKRFHENKIVRIMPKIIVVDDVINTGSTIYSYIRMMNGDGFEVISVASVFGDAEITPDNDAVHAFVEAFVKTCCNEKDIDTDRIISGASTLFSKGELADLTEQVNKAETQEEQDELAKKIHGVFHERARALLAQDAGPGDHLGGTR